MTRSGVRAIERLVREMSWGTAARPPRQRPEAHQPGERARVPKRRLRAAYALSTVAPLVTAVALVPARVDHAQTVGIVLLMPVVLVALIGGVGPAALAAVSASAAYDFFLTAPYQRFLIDDPDDIVTAITLAVVGVTVGVISGRLTRVAARDAARRSELHQLVEFVRAAAEEDAGPEQLTALACRALTELLNLRDCHWHAGYHGDIGPVLLPDGNVMGYVTSLKPDRAMLPDDLEVPAVYRDVELGRFVLRPLPDHVASYEERLTAATIASLFAAATSSAFHR